MTVRKLCAQRSGARYSSEHLKLHEVTFPGLLSSHFFRRDVFKGELQSSTTREKKREKRKGAEARGGRGARLAGGPQRPARPGRGGFLR